MKEWLDKIRGIKGGVWMLAAACCALAALLLPLSAPADPGGMTEEEQRLSATLSRIAGAGETRISLFCAQTASAFGGGDRAIMGAVIVSRGANDPGVRLALSRAAEALLGLDARQVEVFPMEEE